MSKEIMSSQEIDKLIDIHIFGNQVENELVNPYSTDLNEAWKIVTHFGLWFGFQSKMQFKTMEVSMGNDLSEGEVVTFLFIVQDGIKRQTFGAEGTTLCRAICLSALRAKGVEVEDDVCEITI